MLAHVPSFGRTPRSPSDFLAYPVPKASMHVLGTGVLRCLGVARSASSPKAALALGCSFTPGIRISFGRVICMARAASVPGLWTLGVVLLCGTCVLVWVVLGFGFRLRPATPGWGDGVCVCLRARSACTPPLLAGVCGVGVCAWARVLAVRRTNSTNTWDHGRDSADRNHVKRDTDSCMRRGAVGRGKQIGVFFAGTAPGIVHPGHTTRTTTSDRTTISTPRDDRDGDMGNHRMHQRWLQRNRPDGEQANQKAANKSIHQQSRCRSRNPTADRPHASWACKGQNYNGVPRVSNTMVRQARQRSYPWTQQHTATLPLYN